ncbi:hypothetical protein HK102_005704 [Quaeritorhiza haematococci]|nr:hypothetical protein HK102_005704 [Quaeritorhiza haematococci]
MGDDDVRRRLKQARNARAAVKAKETTVVSPFGTYEQGKLKCVVCHVYVKDAALWPSHLTSKTHRDSVAKLKSIKSGTTSSPPATKPPSRPSAPSSSLVPQKRTSAATGTATTAEPPPSQKKAKNDNGAGSGLGMVAYGSDSEGSDAESPTASSSPPKQPNQDPEELPTADLPADFFDTPPAAPVTAPTASPTPAPQTEDSEPPVKSDLPSDFFDELPPDLKAAQERETEQRLAREMLEFQKVIEEETKVAEVVEAAEEEEEDEWREDDDRMESVSLEARFAALRDKKQGWETAEKKREEKEGKTSGSLMSRLMKKVSKGKNAAFEFGDDDEDEEEDDEDVNDDDLFAWRNRGIL